MIKYRDVEYNVHMYLNSELNYLEQLPLQIYIQTTFVCVFVCVCVCVCVFGGGDTE